MWSRKRTSTDRGYGEISARLPSLAPQGLFQIRELARTSRLEASSRRMHLLDPGPGLLRSLMRLLPTGISKAGVEDKLIVIATIVTAAVFSKAERRACPALKEMGQMP
ncbi:hypothetical protein ACP70R_018665 [Stipagrostis hirtigluma subsp. patula]